MRLAAAGISLLVVICLPLAAKRLSDEIYRRTEPEIAAPAPVSAPKPAIVPPIVASPVKTAAAGGTAPPRPEAPAKPETHAKPEIKPAAGAYTVPAPTPRSARVVEVQRGDTIESIAERHHVSISAILTANNMMTTAVAPGQRLVIPR